MYVDYQTIPLEYHFTDTKKIVVNYNQTSTSGPVPINWLLFSYIRSEDYELDQDYYDK